MNVYQKFRDRIMGESNSKDSRNRNNEENKNPINEIQILEGHKDIVRYLTRVDESRICSGSDDGTLRIWNRITGACELVLEGHTLPITCMLLLQSNRLVSGSADKTIRIWDLRDGQSIVLKAHEGSIKCIVSLGSGKFCSGSNDKQLCIWTNEGEKINNIERQEEENLHCLLPISGNRLITASNSSLLLVYKTDTCTYLKVLAYHRESVRCLVRASSTLFASASMDGAIVIWQTETLTPLKVLFNPEKYKDENRVYIYNVKYLLSLGERYLAATIGNGFRIYEVSTGDCVLDCKDAHEAEVNHLISLYDGTRIVSCSADSSIRFWTTKQKVNFRRREKVSNEKGTRSKKLSKFDYLFLGEMWGHSDSVCQLLAFTENSFASCSNDGTVILWKDGRVESELRNRFAAAFLTYQNGLIQRDYSNHAFGESFPDMSMDMGDPAEDSDEALSEEPKLRDELENMEFEDRREISSTVPPKTNSIRIPEHIFEHAEKLRKERNFSFDQIIDELRSQGHSNTTVFAVIQRQFPDITLEQLRGDSKPKTKNQDSIDLKL